MVINIAKLSIKTEVKVSLFVIENRLIMLVIEKLKCLLNLK